MKTIEELEDEYEQYQSKQGIIHTPEDLFDYIMLGIEENEKNIKTYLSDKKSNKRLQLFERIHNFINFMARPSDLSFYDEDNKIIDECLELTASQNNYFLSISDLMTEDNIGDLLKLVDFSCVYYNRNLEYLEMKRDSLEYAYKGIFYTNSRYEDNRELFDKFINRKLAELRKEKTFEKTQKI